METTGFKDPTKRKIRLTPIKPSSLPAHPAFAELQQDHVDLQAFLHEVLAEAVAFSDSVIPETFQKKGAPRNEPHSDAQVQILSSDLIQGEAWFARQSIHKPGKTAGTAEYQEFENGLFHDHSVHEKDYTPDIYHANKVLDYSEQIARLPKDAFEPNTFSDIVIEVFEMCHAIPFPLTKRLFATLVVRAKTGNTSFVVAQLPIDLSEVPAAFYSTGRNLSEGDSKDKRAKVVQGRYVSVERVKTQGTAEETDTVIWEMATASDAGGSLPMAIQKMALPGAIAKDVGLFLKWTADQRK